MRRLQKAQFIAKLLAGLPYIRLVVLSGSVASGKAGSQSDIDFLIVGGRGHLWTARYLCVLLVTLLGQKSYPLKKKTDGRICLPLYLSEGCLSMRKVWSKSAAWQKSWLQTLKPLSGEPAVWQDFCRQNRLSTPPISQISPIGLIGKEILEFILAFYLGWLLEKLLRWWQNRRLERYRQMVNPPAGEMRWSDEVIKLHTSRKG